MQGPLILTIIPLTETVGPSRSSKASGSPGDLCGWVFSLAGDIALSTPHPVITQPKNKSCKAPVPCLSAREKGRTLELKNWDPSKMATVEPETTTTTNPPPSQEEKTESNQEVASPHHCSKHPLQNSAVLKTI